MQRCTPPEDTALIPHVTAGNTHLSQFFSKWSFTIFIWALRKNKNKYVSHYIMLVFILHQWVDFVENQIKCTRGTKISSLQRSGIKIINAM